MFLKPKVAELQFSSKRVAFASNSHQPEISAFLQCKIFPRIECVETTVSLQLQSRNLRADRSAVFFAAPDDEAMRGMKGVILREANDRNRVAVLLSLLEHEAQITINRMQLARVG
jgi:hypothetical protein